MEAIVGSLVLFVTKEATQSARLTDALKNKKRWDKEEKRALFEDLYADWTRKKREHRPLRRPKGGARGNLSKAPERGKEATRGGSSLP